MKVAIIATRIAGNDGVSLEAVRWSEILKKMGHSVKLVAGQLDRSGYLIPELHFQHPEVVKLHDQVIYGQGSYRKIEAEIFSLADLLIVPNVFSLPMHFPLAVALARVIEELKIPTIARHHDFWWERKRFTRSTMFPFFHRRFPPDNPLIKHVVINSLAQKELKKRTQLSSTIIWDSFDFNSNLANLDSYSRHWRQDFGLAKDDIVFLQATRIVPRKRIELAINLIQKLTSPQIVLVIAGKAGDETGDYKQTLLKLVKKTKIRAKFIGDQINSKRRVVRDTARDKPSTKRIYTLWDCFVNADFITYPTKIEGFGNQFVESIYFKKPIILTPYPVYESDIKPLGFKTLEISPKLSRKSINKIKSLINNPSETKAITDYNFKLGQKYLSFQYVEKKLNKLL
jgi:glycosyltransferase involved in cell wall biosynthesis